MKNVKKFFPLLLSFGILLMDQLSKNWIVAHIPEDTVGYSLFGDFLRIVHVTNNAVAFSLGSSLSQNIRSVLFILVPILVLCFILYLMYGKDSEVTPYQRWLLAAFLGGGMGNLWDRLFRGFQVVDFMENRVYGLFGLEFWPVWNLADATLVISGCLLLLSMLAKSLHSRSKNSKNEH